MNHGPYVTSKAISTLMVGIAFFFPGCLPGSILERAQKEKDIQNQFILAERNFETGNYDKAIKRYKLYLRKNPKGERSRRALYRMAQINLKRNLYVKSLSLLKKIAEEYPDHPEMPAVKYDTATSLYGMKDYDASIIETLEWIKKYPDNPLKGDTLFLLGKNFRESGDNPKALHWWLQAVEIFYDSPEKRDKVHDTIIELINNSSLKDLKEMENYAATSHYSPHIYHRVASIYLEENKLDQAMDVATVLIQSSSEQKWISTGKQIIERIKIKMPIKIGSIGCLLPLSGPFAIYGHEALNGIQMGMDIFDKPDRNQKIELIIRDTRGRVEETVSGVEELVEKEKVMAIIGPLASKPALAAAKKAQELGVPIITITQKEGITSQGDMVYRNFLTPSKEIRSMLDKIINEMGLMRFAILFPENPYGRFFMNLFLDSVEEMGGEITAVESYNPDETDFAAEITMMARKSYVNRDSEAMTVEESKALEVQEKVGYSSGKKLGTIVDFDAVFIPDNYNRVALIAPQFPFNDLFNIRFLGTSLWQSSELLEIAGEYLQGAIFPSGFYKESESYHIKEFVEMYKEYFESDPGILAANGYDTIRVLKKLMEKGMILTRKNLQRNLSRFQGYHGITGKISFDHLGEVEKEPILLTISGRHFHILP
ncbi:MAG: penicillin-binding protein activator [Thermodesulfobacteriota bacterium]|nr:penicillin-binding protein activator [Thermodesulfobacteriota bacterium]